MGTSTRPFVSPIRSHSLSRAASNTDRRCRTSRLAGHTGCGEDTALNRYRMAQGHRSMRKPPARRDFTRGDNS
jgi:hypothetical protein